MRDNLLAEAGTTGGLAICGPPSSFESYRKRQKPGAKENRKAAKKPAEK